MIGVSPAFVVSLFGPRFSPSHFLEALPIIREIGFSAYQPEIYLTETLSDWRRDGQKVHSAAVDLGLTSTQFVAHFMLKEFTIPYILDPFHGTDELNRVLEIVRLFSPCPVLTIPAPQFFTDWHGSPFTGIEEWRDLRQRLADKVRCFVEIVAGAELKLAFEILPFSAFGGTAGFIDLCRDIGSPSLGLNLDTGHAWTCREILPSLPFDLQGRVFGLHLGENTDRPDTKLGPGKGTIPWEPFLKNLTGTGYRGSWDIEIACHPDRVVEEYRFGLAYLQSLSLFDKGGHTWAAP